MLVAHQKTRREELVHKQNHKGFYSSGPATPFISFISSKAALSQQNGS